MATRAFAYAAPSVKAPLEPFTFERRAMGPDDVVIDIKYCGVCHSDVHQARDEWGGSMFPMVPGHEIVGVVSAVGADVKDFKVGESVGVGCMVDSCMSCSSCKKGVEQYCKRHTTFTYNCLTDDGEKAYGGYSSHIVVRQHFVLHMPKNLDMCAAAPLLCAGVTTWAPLKYWGVTKGSRVGVVGLGGLGHMAVKLAHAMGAEVTVFTTSEKKFAAAKELGAHHVVQSTNPEQMKAAEDTLDLIIDTVGASHDLNPYMSTLDVDGKIALVGMPEHPHPAFNPRQLISHRNAIGGSNIGGIKETQEMLDFCGEHNILPEIEKINIDYINEAYERMLKSDVKYRFVIDMASLKRGE